MLVSPSVMAYGGQDFDEHLRLQCQICLTPAPRGSKHYYHYGAICCSKCKAFFRRCKRCGDRLGVEFPNFPCVSGTNRCIINYLNAEKCKKCRLVKCLEAGKLIENITNLLIWIVWKIFRGKFLHACKFCILDKITFFHF